MRLAHSQSIEEGALIASDLGWASSPLNIGNFSRVMGAI